MKIILYFILFFTSYFVSTQITNNVIVSMFWKITWSNALITEKNVNLVVWSWWDYKVIKEIRNNWEENNIKNIKITPEIDYMEINGRKILVKRDNDNLIWANFIVYKKVYDKNHNLHYYFYAHSWPSEYYIWKYFKDHITIWSIIEVWNVTNNTVIKYKVYNVKSISEDIRKKEDINFKWKNDSLFFTCDKDWTRRKIFLLTKIQ